ncbi:Gfo/Idh/MocA family oxidoreductase [Agromyces silvae]|uniref:Gfo/Idh/MocA family oxidoreductase n=1 Tax=Agromyces silvae TaxID=3388266 RepID=UPI00280BFB0B|nr:Gfo/Idh/MocA family oxidoreductase [Agromyces protaetiae]
MLIGFIGLETSHPFSDAGNLRALCPDAEFLVTGEADRVAAFRADNATTRVTQSAESVIASAPDVVVVSVRPADVAHVVEQLAAARIPAFINKPAAASDAEVDALVEAARGAEELFLTSSVLRFAPRVGALDLDRDDVLAVSVTLSHDVGWWEDPAFSWQDADEGSGGLVPVMGVHALDVLAAVFGPGLEVEYCRVATRTHLRLTNGDVGQLAVRLPSGARALIGLVGVSSREEYAFTFHSPVGDTRLVLSSDVGEEDPLGYVGTARQIIAMARGAASPVPLHESASILRSLATASTMAREAGLGR